MLQPAHIATLAATVLGCLTAATCCHGFSGLQQRPAARALRQKSFTSSTSLWSSILSTPTHQQQENTPADDNNATPQQRTAISMTLEELSDALGGFGRSQLAWDCYRKGVDPHYLFRTLSLPSHQEEDNDDKKRDKSELLLSPLHQHFGNEYSHSNIESLKKQILPTPRQAQTLGTSALNLLSSTIHSHCNGCIENGLATLVHISPSSTDGTTKLLLRFMDGWEVETVLIPFWSNDNNSKQSVEEEGSNGRTVSKRRNKTAAATTTTTTTGRTTVCISSQVGCRQGCTFCATGKMGKLRSLTTDEILVQFFFAQKIVRLSNTNNNNKLYNDNNKLYNDNNNNKLYKDDIGAMIPLPPITNVVFMGMGEPADNAVSVRGAIDILTRNELFQLSASRVTVSTVAPCPDSFLEFVDSKCVLAWSVHAVRDELRRQLVPTTKYTMVELRQGLIEALKRRSLRTTMVEVALIDGVNDSIREADELATFVKEITTQVPNSKLICNLIPYNDIGGGGGTASSFRKPSLERLMEFQQRLQELGVYAHVRGTRGDDESAACGQLATSRKKQQQQQKQ